MRFSNGVRVPRRFGGFAQVLQTVQVAILGRILTRMHVIFIIFAFNKIFEYACEDAARNGHLDCLKYLRETAKAPWDEVAVKVAHNNEHTECLQYLLDNDCPLPEGLRYEDRELHVPESESESETESE